jgi:signal transduction histidine kinase
VRAVAAGPGVSVRGDRIRLEQALGNLVDNSLRHGDGCVRLRATQVDGVVELHVADEGSGFPPAFLDSAFERFSRPDAARAGGGTGLGLAIVRTIAEAHGGETHAANRERGADVWLVLPAG